MTAKVSYPKFRASQWIDTSPAALRRRTAKISYGVQVKLSRNGKWFNLCDGPDNEPIFFDTLKQWKAALPKIKERFARKPDAASERAAA